MLYSHQQKIINDNPNKCGLFLGTGGGKTRTALMLARGRTLIIMPKTQFLDGNWQREFVKLYDEKIFPRINMIESITSMSKEQFKKEHAYLGRYDTVIIDEAHTVCGVTPNIRYRDRKPIPKASQIFEAAYDYLSRTRPERVYLCTATPARNPMAVWAAGKLMRKFMPSWEAWRKMFYVRIPMPGREVWQVNKTPATKEKLARLVRSIGYVGRLQDWFDVPAQIDRVVECDIDGRQREEIENMPLEYPDPLVLIGKTHQAEQGMSKIEMIEEFLEEFPKVLVFARYRRQIDEIAGYFEGKVPVYTLTGDTIDRREVISSSEKSNRCVCIVQSQVSTGYELPSFRCTIFASMSYSHVDHMQARGRVLRANALNKNLYVYLVSGEIDKAVLKCAQDHVDFDERLYAKRSLIPNKIQ